MLDEFEKSALEDSLEGWELVEYLQVPIEEVLQVAIDNGWVTVENEQELLDWIGRKN